MTEQTHVPNLQMTPSSASLAFFLMECQQVHMRRMIQSAMIYLGIKPRRHDGRVEVAGFSCQISDSLQNMRVERPRKRAQWWRTRGREKIVCANSRCTLSIKKVVCADGGKPRGVRRAVAFGRWNDAENRSEKAGGRARSKQKRGFLGIGEYGQSRDIDVCERGILPG